MKKQKMEFKGKLLNVVKQQKMLPNGRLMDLEIVKHPGAVLIIPLLSRYKMVFLEQYRPVIDRYILELPAGTLNEGERPLDCARRELREETGYIAKKISRLGQIYPTPGYTTEKITIYLAHGLERDNPALEDDEIIEPCVLSRKQTRELFEANRIVDAKTICALAFCGWL